MGKFNIYKALLMCAVLILISYSSFAQMQGFKSNDIFKTDYFIENKGQYDRIAGESSLKNYGFQLGNSLYLIGADKISIFLSDSVEKSAKRKDPSAHSFNTNQINLKWLKSKPNLISKGLRQTQHYFS